MGGRSSAPTTFSASSQAKCAMGRGIANSEPKKFFVKCRAVLMDFCVEMASNAFHDAGFVTAVFPTATTDLMRLAVPKY